MARKRQMKKKTSRKQRGGDWFSPSTWKSPFSSSTPAVGSTPAPGPLPGSAAADAVVEEGAAMATTAGKRLKPLLGGNPASPGDAQKALGTAKGDNMLGGRKRRGKATRRRRKY